MLAARPLDVNRTIQGVVAMLLGTGKLSGIEIVLAFTQETVLVTANKAGIEQVLVNLIVHAAEAIGSAPGKILLAVQPDKDRRRVRIEVSDTSVGMPPEVLERVFDPEYNARTGAGFPTLREIVRSYGGELTVTSVVGVGTSSTFDLPMSTAR